MAQIVLGIGTSHSPMLNTTADEWACFQQRDAQRMHHDKGGREVSYAELLALAPPDLDRHLSAAVYADKHARAQRDLDRLAQAIAQAQLDALIVVGDDQKELFQEDNLPSILVYRGDSILNAATRERIGPPWYQRAFSRYFDDGQGREYPVAAELAEHLIAGLIEREFDVATSKMAPPGTSEGHAFAFVHKRLLSPDAPVPIVPLCLNTYYPPNQPLPRRCHDLGRALREALASYSGPAQRIGVLASGGLSHLTIDEQLDQEVIDALRRHDAQALRSLPACKLRAGSSEIRNWICVAGAVEHLRVDWLDYIAAYRTPASTGTGLCFAIWSGGR